MGRQSQGLMVHYYFVNERFIDNYLIYNNERKGGIKKYIFIRKKSPETSSRLQSKALL